MSNNSEQTKNVPNEEKLPFIRKFGYTWSGIAYLFCMLLPAYIMYFCTQSLALAVGSVSIMIMLVKILDGVVDLFAGILIDKTKSPQGKARPWFLRMAFPYALCLALIFYVPASLSSTAKLILVAVLYALTVSVFGTILGVARYSLIPRMTSDQKERYTLGILGDGVPFLLMGVLMALTMPIVKAIGWRMTFTIYAIVAFIASLLCYALTREKNFEINTGFAEESDRKRTEIKDFFKTLFTNKYALYLLIYALIVEIAGGLLQVGPLYYFQFVLKNMDLYTLVMLGTVVSGLIGMVLAGFITKKTGKIFGIGCIGAVVCFVALLINNGASNIVTLIFVDLAAMFGITFTITAFGPMAANTIEYGEYKTGVRAEGVTSAVVNIGIKIGTALASALLGGIMAAGGFVSGSDTQSASAVNSIRMGYLVAPLVIFAVIGIFFFLTYNLDKKYPEIVAELNKRKGIEK